MPQDMQYWKRMSDYSLKGKDGWLLRQWLKEPDGTCGYKLTNDAEKAPYIDEKKFKETQSYFYAPIMLKNGVTVYSYVSKSPGGAIPFRGKGRWSGNPEGLGKDLGIKLVDVTIGNTAGWAMSTEDAAQILNKNFAGLRYEIKDGTIMVNWNKTIKELKAVGKLRRIIRKEIEEVSKNIKK